MDWQPKYHPQGDSALFADGRSMRPLVEGTVSVGNLAEDDAFYRGRAGSAPDAPYVTKIPTRTADGQPTLKLDERFVRRGQERFNVFCSPCHDRTGAGRGLVVQRGYPPPPSLTADHVHQMADGEVFNIITHGVRNMPAYNVQIPAEDRWAIVAWVRVLRRSQHGHLKDVPAERRGSIEPAEGQP
jgi:mono/diheme cytochrome c family protein